MIKIKRGAAPSFLVNLEEKWCKEIEEAKRHYENGSTAAFEFKMYKDTLLKNELEKIFIKCAYCESPYTAVYDGDVEHFRPKGKVNEKTPKTPGYYWLANDWDNLFLSCQHCNQRRKHILYGEEKLKGYGKLDQFPLDTGGETRRLNTPEDDFDAEEKVRLLINPCKDEPDRHFAYEKKEGVIVPLTKMGVVSMNVYALLRPRLVKERKKRMLSLFTQMTRVKRKLEDLNAAPGEENKIIELRFEFNALIEFIKADAPYAGMCRYFVKEFLVENRIK
jgi:uncharacterized protein (TIGR02646 family)